MNNKFNAFVFERLSRNGMLKFLPDKHYVMIDYLIFKGELPDLKNPLTFSEKIQWIKIYGGIEKYSPYVDKYEVRKYVEKTIGKEYLVPLIGVWDKFDDIPFDKLPDKFILKSTNGSGNNFICSDKSKLNKKELKKSVDKWMGKTFYFEHREAQYRDFKPRIICEEFLGNETTELRDYKLFCSSGIPKIVEVYIDVYKDTKVNLFDMNWKKLNISLHFPNTTKYVKKPKELPQMVEIAKKLSKNFPFVRVDLYLLGNKIYFGEFTFTPGDGMYITRPPEGDYKLGELIDISKFNK